MNPSQNLQDEQKWEQTYQKVLAFAEVFGHLSFSPTQGDENMLRVAEWLEDQKGQTKLSSQQRLKLQALKKYGYELGSSELDRREDVWNCRFEQLVEFKRETGHLKVPKSYSLPLQKWVNLQRHLARRGKLSAEREERLLEIGLDFKIEASRRYSDLHIQKWDEMYRQLIAYKDRYGDCMVPTQNLSFIKLGCWVATQRQNKEQMDERRRQLLDDIGFVWKVSRKIR